MHGYDVVAHDEVNPELGGREGFDRFCAALREHGLGQLLDLVPNHMGVTGGDNVRWMDVLENGPASLYAQHFDIDWRPASRAWPLLFVICRGVRRLMPVSEPSGHVTGNCSELG